MIRSRTTILFWAMAALFMTACLLVAAAADAWLTPAPRFETDGGALVIEGERLLDCLPPGGRGFEQLSDGLRLYANRDLLFHAATAGEGRTPLFIIARGTPLGGVWPLLTLRVDRKLQEGFFVTSREWGLYRVELKLPPGDHHFRISYANDRSRFPANRDLDISMIALGAPPVGWEGLVRWRRESVIPAGRFSRQRFAKPEGAAVRLWQGGLLADDVFYPADGMQKVSLLAASAGAGGGRLALLVDGERVEEFVVTDDPSRHYRALFETAAGLRRLELVSLEGEVLVRHLMADGAAPLPPQTAEPLYLRGTGLSIPARLLEVEAEGRLLEDGSRLLWSNGHVGRIISNDSPRTARLTLIARGELCEGEGPRLLLMVGDDQLATIRVDEERFSPYSIDLELEPGEQRISLVYINDRFLDGECDRNLIIRELRLEGAP